MNQKQIYISLYILLLVSITTASVSLTQNTLSSPAFTPTPFSNSSEPFVPPVPSSPPFTPTPYSLNTQGFPSLEPSAPPAPDGMSSPSYAETPLGAPILGYPVNQILPAGPQDFTYTFSAVPGASTYSQEWFQLDTDNKTWKHLSVGSGFETPEIDASVINNGFFAWRAWAVNSNGVPGEKSSWAYFSLGKNQVKPSNVPEPGVSLAEPELPCESDSYAPRTEIKNKKKIAKLTKQLKKLKGTWQYTGTPYFSRCFEGPYKLETGTDAVVNENAEPFTVTFQNNGFCTNYYENPINGGPWCEKPTFFYTDGTFGDLRGGQAFMKLNKSRLEFYSAGKGGYEKFILKKVSKIRK